MTALFALLGVLWVLAAPPEPPTPAWIRQFDVIAIVTVEKADAQDGSFSCAEAGAQIAFRSSVTVRLTDALTGAEKGHILRIDGPALPPGSQALLFARRYCGRLAGVARRIHPPYAVSRGHLVETEGPAMVVWWGRFAADHSVPLAEALKLVRDALSADSTSVPR